MEQDYEIVSVQPTEPPKNMAGSNWHCYVIVQGTNTIRGYRQGNLGSVTKAVEEIVMRLNERRVGKRGPVQLVIPSSKKQASQDTGNTP